MKIFSFDNCNNIGANEYYHLRIDNVRGIYYIEEAFTGSMEYETALAYSIPELKGKLKMLEPKSGFIENIRSAARTEINKL